MLVVNLTSKYQTFQIKEVVGSHAEYDICVAPDGSVDVENRFRIVNPDKYKGVLCFGTEDITVPQEVHTEVHEHKEVVDTPEITEDAVDSVVPERTKKKSDEGSTEAFICEFCGAEFASARGLATHKSKSHEN